MLALLIPKFVLYVLDQCFRRWFR